MKTADSIAIQFNDYITRRDADALAEMMTDDHTFIDSNNNIIRGRMENKKNWERFFELLPAYRNIFENITIKESTVILQGYSICSDQQLNNVHAIWVVQIQNDLVKEWRIYTIRKD